MATNDFQYGGWNSYTLQYLGVVLRSARAFKRLFDHAKIKFYRCFNAMPYRSKNDGSQRVCVQLLKPICLLVLLYAVEVLPLTKSETAMLNHVTDRAVYRIFGSCSAEDFKYLRSVVGLPCVSVYIDSRRSKFLQQYASPFSWSFTWSSLLSLYCFLRVFLLCHCLYFYYCSSCYE